MTDRKVKGKKSLALGTLPPGTPRPSRWAPRLRWAALAVLVVVGCLRMLLTEALGPAWSTIGWVGGGPTAATSMAFAACIVLAGLLWMLAQALAPRPVVGWAGLALVGLFVFAAVVSTAVASDKAAARNASVQVGCMLLAFWLLLQLLDCRRLRQAALSAVLAAGLLFALQGLYQHYYENPQFFQHDWPREREAFFQRQGWSPDSPQARQYDERVRSAEVKGFAVNSNMAAALLLLVLLASAGWAIQKWSAPPRPLGRTFAALATAAPLTALWALWLTGSRGGVLAGGVAIILLAVLAALRGWAARHWRGLMAAAGVGVLAGAIALTVFAARMRQPEPDSRWYRSGAANSLLVRWHYWTGAAAAWRQSPLAGVGGDNFRSAYLRHKRPEALEEVADAHNFVITAFVEYGLAGGVAVVGLLVWVLVGLARAPSPAPAPPQPRPDRGQADPDEPDRAEPYDPSLLKFAVALPLAIAVLRAAIQWPNYGEALSNAAIALLGPVLLLAMLLTADRLGWPSGLGEHWTRLATGCGLAGFLLACTVDMAMFQSGPATAFWMLAAIALSGTFSRHPEPTPAPARKVSEGVREKPLSLEGRGVGVRVDRRQTRDFHPSPSPVPSMGEGCHTRSDASSRPAWTAATAVGGMLLAALIANAYRPVAHSERLMNQIVDGRQPVATVRPEFVTVGYPPGFFDQALGADPLQPAVPQFMADQLLRGQADPADATPADDPDRPVRIDLDQAARLYDEARRRDPANFRNWLSAGRIALELADSPDAQRQALATMARGVELHPTSVIVRRDYAQALMRAGRFDDAAEQFAEALRLDDILHRYDPKPQKLFALGEEGPGGRKALEQAHRAALDAARSAGATGPPVPRDPWPDLPPAPPPELP